MPKDRDKLRRQMAARGWTEASIAEAIAQGARAATVNKETGGPATRYTHPTTQRSVVVDDETNEIIHVGGDGFLY